MDCFQFPVPVGKADRSDDRYMGALNSCGTSKLSACSDYAFALQEDRHWTQKSPAGQMGLKGFCYSDIQLTAGNQLTGKATSEIRTLKEK